MNILLTNDDGYNSIGINLLKEKLSKFGKVVLVAPELSMSGKSVSIIYGRSVRVNKVSEDVYSMEGTPADCVAFGLSSLNIKFDLVVSGVNDGLNIAFDILYSGTIGACLQALTYRVPTIAFSTQPGYYDVVEKHFDEVMDYVIKHNMLSKGHVINVNFPVNNIVKGIKETHVHYREENAYYVKAEEGKFLALRDVKDNECCDENSDAYAVYNSYISITKLNKML